MSSSTVELYLYESGLGCGGEFVCCKCFLFSLRCYNLNADILTDLSLDQTVCIMHVLIVALPGLALLRATYSAAVRYDRAKIIFTQHHLSRAGPVTSV